MDIIANEVRYVEKLLANKTLTTRKASKEIRLVAQYHLSSGLSVEEATEETVGFIGQVNGNNSGEKWRKTINGMIKDILKKNDLKMRQVDTIYFSKKEVETIASLDKEVQRRYAWGILVLCKVINHGKKNKWLTIEHTNKFCKKIGVRLSTVKNRELVFHELKNAQLLKISRQTGNTSMEVLYIEDEGEIVASCPTFNHLTFEENYFENAMKLYEMIFNGARVYKCEVCKGYALAKTRTKKYCDTCAEEVKRGRVKNG